MLKMYFTEEVEADSKVIWELWKDLPSWPLWNVGLSKCCLYDRFKKGSKAILELNSGRRVLLQFTEVHFLKRFSDVIYLPAGKIVTHHKMEKAFAEGKLLITHGVEWQIDNQQEEKDVLFIHWPRLKWETRESLKKLVQIASEGQLATCR